DPALDPLASGRHGGRRGRDPGLRTRGGDRPVPAPGSRRGAGAALLHPEPGRAHALHRPRARLSRRPPLRGRDARPPADPPPPTHFDTLTQAEPTLSIVRALACAGARRCAAGMPAPRPTPAARPAAIPASRRDCLSWPLDPEARSPAPLMDIDLVSRPIEAGDRLRTPAPPADPAGSLLRHYRLDVRSVAIGMWVAELDRPWLDTPFLIRGFRVENEQELETLRRHCEYVEVDIEKSDFEVVEA